MRHLLPIVLVVFGLVGHVMVQAAPAWKKVHTSTGGRDFASYYYAAEVALDGGDPYDTARMSARAREEGVRKSVHPFFYPPPFLLSVAWAGPVSLQAAYEVWFFLNEALLLLCLGLGVRAFGVPIWAAAMLLWTWSPIPDNAWMGQANLLALAPALLGLAVAPKRPWLGGALVGVAAMLKMSPALFLGWWLLQRNWRAVGAAVVTAIGSSLLALPLVGFEAQTRFYLEILPGFSTGDYHGLTVPISLEANHSVGDLADRLFPGPGPLLSEGAQGMMSGVLLALLLLVAWHARGTKNPAAILGALTVLMVVTPVYAYEHHLVFLVVAMGTAAGGASQRMRELAASGRWASALCWGLALALTWFFLAWPLPWLRAAQAALPSSFGWVTRESKTMAEAALFALCLALARDRVNR
ncbi:MAG: DUF2029 domain-containing protein [Myxococcales bacterium]|nr:DUF2029 domain-containing protein [Myxococcales bacterium]